MTILEVLIQLRDDIKLWVTNNLININNKLSIHDNEIANLKNNTGGTTNGLVFSVNENGILEVTYDEEVS